jgi:hypothetical protein
VVPLLSTVNGVEDDDFGLAIDGWQQWLRPESFKTFIELTDDRAQCNANNVAYTDTNTLMGSTAAANKFDAALRALYPQHFAHLAADPQLPLVQHRRPRLQQPAGQALPAAGPVRERKVPAGVRTPATATRPSA